MTLRLGTRGSALALAQSRLVAAALTSSLGEPVDLVEIVTDGDRSSAPVPELGVGVFVSTLRDALSAKEIDIAVHSYKDLPSAPVDGLTIAAVPVREDPRDVPPALDLDVHLAMKDERDRDTDGHAGGDLPQHAGKDACQHSPRRRAERHPNADLAAPPGDGKGHEGVQSSG